AGLLGDRVYGFVRADGFRGFPWHTGREQESLVRYRPQFQQPRTVPPDVEVSLSLGPGVNPVFPGDDEFDVEVVTPEGRTLPIRSSELAAELAARGGAPVTLRFSERCLSDCRPLSLFGNATARGLASELGMALDRRRFRANFYVDWDEMGSFREDALVGRTLQIGDRAQIAVLERDPRCKMITIDPDTGETTPQIHRHLMTAHDGMAGVYAAVLREGIVRKGDPISLV